MNLQPETCSNWESIAGIFDSFPPPRLGFDSEADPRETLWVFRGHKCARYNLSPKIERECAQKPDWAMIEFKILQEFKSLARMHLDPSEVPVEDNFSWLALMQHYGIPTRLIDFTLSPYIALYFAISNRSRDEQEEPPEVWAIDAQALLRIAKHVTQQARREEEGPLRRHASTTVSAKLTASLDPRFALNYADQLQNENVSRSGMTSAALSATGIRRSHFNRNGFVTFAVPPIQNLRLSNQQSAFLLSGAGELTFAESLSRMMHGQKAGWCRRLTIKTEKTDSLTDFERRLFQNERAQPIAVSRYFGSGRIYCPKGPASLDTRR